MSGSNDKQNVSNSNENPTETGPSQLESINLGIDNTRFSINRNILNTDAVGGFYYYVPARHFLTFMTFWAFFLVYALRVNLSVAIVAMVKPSGKNSSNGNDTECPASDTAVTSFSYTGMYDAKPEFDWDEKTKGLILGAFFYGYVITQIPGGWLAEKFGGKWLLGGGVLCTSLFTLILPLAARWNIVALIITRVIAGIGEGVTYPAVYAIYSKWIPSQEYSFQLALSQAGAPIGTVFTLPIAALLCNVEYDNGWPLVFYIFGGLGCLWFLFFILLITNTPEEHAFITRKELRYIQENRQTLSASDQHLPYPWKKILTCIPLWAVSASKFFNSWVFYTMLTELPNYMQAVLHFNLTKSAWQNSLLYLAQAVTGIIGGLSADYIRSVNYFSVTTIRKAYETFAGLGCCICLVFVPLVGCEKLSIFLLLVSSLALLGFTAGGDSPIALDLAPNFAGTLYGISNAISNMAGVFAPMVTGIIVNDNDTMSGWSPVFYLSALLQFIGVVVFIIFGSAETLPWANSNNYVLLATDSNADNNSDDEDQTVSS